MLVALLLDFFQAVVSSGISAAKSSKDCAAEDGCSLSPHPFVWVPHGPHREGIM